MRSQADVGTTWLRIVQVDEQIKRLPGCENSPINNWFQCLFWSGILAYCTNSTRDSTSSVHFSKSLLSIIASWWSCILSLQFVPSVSPDIQFIQFHNSLCSLINSWNKSSQICISFADRKYFYFIQSIADCLIQISFALSFTESLFLPDAVLIFAYNFGVALTNRSYQFPDVLYDIKKDNSVFLLTVERYYKLTFFFLLFLRFIIYLCI